MGRSRKHKAAQQYEIKPWASAKGDNKEERFTQTGNSLLFSKEWQSLSYGARCLYACMRMECGGEREFEFKHKAAKKYGFPSSSYDRYRRELEEAGFITNVSRIEQYAPIRYRFCYEWKQNSHPKLGSS